MRLLRLFKHLLYPGWLLHRRFDLDDLAAIEIAIEASEKQHSGEVRFAVESALPINALRRDESVEERALEVFSMLRVWDTEQNNGVLIYVCLADRQVAIVADRAIHCCVDENVWKTICENMRAAFSNDQYGDAVIQGIDAISALLAADFPYREGDRNELPNKPEIL